jgi:hypothetical protein
VVCRDQPLRAAENEGAVVDGDVPPSAPLERQLPRAFRSPAVRVVTDPSPSGTAWSRGTPIAASAARRARCQRAATPSSACCRSNLRGAPSLVVAVAAISALQPLPPSTLWSSVIRKPPRARSRIAEVLARRRLHVTTGKGARFTFDLNCPQSQIRRGPRYICWLRGCHRVRAPGVVRSCARYGTVGVMDASDHKSPPRNPGQ